MRWKLRFSNEYPQKSTETSGQLNVKAEPMNCDCEVNEAMAKLGRYKGAFWLWPDIARILNGFRRRWDKTRAKIFFFFSMGV